MSKQVNSKSSNVDIKKNLYFLTWDSTYENSTRVYAKSAEEAIAIVYDVDFEEDSFHQSHFINIHPKTIKASIIDDAAVHIEKMIENYLFQLSLGYKLDIESMRSDLTNLVDYINDNYPKQEASAKQHKTVKKPEVGPF